MIADVLCLRDLQVAGAHAVSEEDVGRLRIAPLRGPGVRACDARERPKVQAADRLGPTDDVSGRPLAAWPPHRGGRRQQLSAINLLDAVR